MQSAQNFKDLKFVGNFGGKEIDVSFVFLKPLQEMVQLKHQIQLNGVLMLKQTAVKRDCTTSEHFSRRHISYVIKRGVQVKC